MKKFSLLLAAVLMMASFPASAQQAAGDSELQLQGSLTLGIDGDVPDNGSVFLNYGRFFTDRQEAGISVGAFIFNGSDWGGVGGPFYRYNFSTGKTVPYVGAAAATTFGDFSTGDILLNLEGGVRWFLQRNIAFTVAGTSNYDVDANDFSDQLQIQFGFSYIWGK